VSAFRHYIFKIAFDIITNCANFAAKPFNDIRLGDALIKLVISDRNEATQLAKCHIQMSGVQFGSAKVIELTGKEKDPHFRAISRAGEENIVRYHFLAAVLHELVERLHVALDVFQQQAESSDGSTVDLVKVADKLSQCLQSKVETITQRSRFNENVSETHNILDVQVMFDVEQVKMEMVYAR
jgi:hypothetical protein